jgi:hypothetical protein
MAQEDDVWHYSLYIQKQGGTGGHEVEVALILPPGAEVVAAYPAPARREGDTLMYELSLQTDLELEVRLRAR